MDYAISYLCENFAENLYIYPQESHFESGKIILWEDEYKFCQQLIEEINAGISLVETKNNNLVLQLKNGEKYEILLNEFNKSKENEILKKTLEKVKKGELVFKAEPGGVENTIFASVVISFCEAPKKEEEKVVDTRFGKRTEAKLKKSGGRKWTESKRQ